MSGPILMILAGANGSGKSYDAVKYQVVPALRARQPVATNIAGIDECLDALAQYVATPAISPFQRLLFRLLKKSEPSFDVEHYEWVKNNVTILPVRREQLLVPEIWPHPDEFKKNPDGSTALPPRDTLVKPGSLVVLDECSTVLSKPVPDFFMQYVTEQRHGVDEYGHEGRMVLISQLWKHITTAIRDIAPVTYQYSKPEALKAISKFLKLDYRIEIFTVAGKDPLKNKPTSVRWRGYDKKMFSLYKSKQGEHGDGVSDSRTSLFRSLFFTVFIPLGLAALYFGGATLFDYLGAAFKPAQSKTVSASSAPAPAVTPASQSNLSSSVSPSVSNSSTAKQVFGGFKGNFNADYRLLGTYSSGSYATYVLVDNTGKYHYAVQSDFESVKQIGNATALKMKDGTLITVNSGSYTPSKQQSTNNGVSNVQSTSTAQSTSTVVNPGAPSSLIR